MKKLGIAADHAGFKLKEQLKPFLTELGYEMVDFGTDGEASCDYADYAHPLANAIENGDLESGIAICGSANGINITLNKHQGIRSAICWLPEIATLARQHNNANVCAMPGRFITFDEAKVIVDQFLNTEFEGGRHQRRIDKMPTNC